MRKNSLGLVLTAQTLSTLGSSISTVALAVMVFDRTGSVLHMGGILAASALPGVVVSVLGGALLDRYPARRLMVVADIARAALVLAMPFAAQLTVATVYLVSAAMGMFTAVFNPSQIKMVGDLAAPGQLMRANSYLSIARDGAELGGYLAGGALVASLGYFATFALDALSYSASALLLLGLPHVPSSSTAKVWSMVKESPTVISGMWKRIPLRVNILLVLIPMAFVFTGTPNAYGLALRVYGSGAQDLALMEAMTAVGWIVGGVLASRINFKGDRNTYVTACGLVMGACSVGIALVGSFWPAVALLAIGAVANVGVIVGSMTLFQELEPRPDKGRIIALRTGIGQLSGAAGLFFGGLLGDIVGIRNVFALAGGASLLSGVVIYLAYVHWKRRESVSTSSAGERQSLSSRLVQVEEPTSVPSEE